MNVKNLLFAFGVGLSFGAGVALLYAPQSGAVTRKKLKNSADDAQDYLEDTAAYLKGQADYLSKEAEKLVKKARTSVEDVVDQAGVLVNDTVKSAQKLV